MMLGFDVAETAVGTFFLFDNPLFEHELRMRLRLGATHLAKFAVDRSLVVFGTVHAASLAMGGGLGSEVSGSVLWRLLDQSRVHYRLSFRGDDGKLYHVRGQRDFFVHNAIGSLTTMQASLYDERETEIGRVLLRFEPKMELLSILRSFRPHFSLLGGVSR